MSHYEPNYFDSHEISDVAFYQLEDGPKAGWWLVTSSDFEEELAGPFATKPEAEAWVVALSE